MLLECQRCSGTVNAACYPAVSAVLFYALLQTALLKMLAPLGICTAVKVDVRSSTICNLFQNLCTCAIVGVLRRRRERHPSWQ